MNFDDSYIILYSILLYRNNSVMNFDDSCITLHHIILYFIIP